LVRLLREPQSVPPIDTIPVCSLSSTSFLRQVRVLTRPKPLTRVYSLRLRRDIPRVAPPFADVRVPIWGHRSPICPVHRDSFRSLPWTEEPLLPQASFRSPRGREPHPHASRVAEDMLPLAGPPATRMRRRNHLHPIFRESSAYLQAILRRAAYLPQYQHHAASQAGRGLGGELP
jgi:hypothetical protein